MLVGEPLRLFRRVSQNPLALLAERQVNRRRYLLTKGRAAFNLLADRFNRSVGAEKAVGQSLVFAQKAQQEVFRFNIRASELAGFITGEEDDAAGLLGIPFKHSSSAYRIIPCWCHVVTRPAAGNCRRLTTDRC